MFARVPQVFLAAAADFPAVKGGLDDDAFEGDHVLLRLLANVYGRRPTGAQWRNKLERELRKLPGHHFERLPHEPCIYYCPTTKAMILHHVDDFRIADRREQVTSLVEQLSRVLWLKIVPIEDEGTVTQFLKREKRRTKRGVMTMPDRRLIDDVAKLLDLEQAKPCATPGRALRQDDASKELLAPGETGVYPTAVGKLVYLSHDRRDIKYLVKELARRMQNPRKCNMLNVKVCQVSEGHA